MDSSIPFQDLNLLPDPPRILISPKIEPKTEPVELPLPVNPNTNEDSMQDISLISPVDESDVYSEFLRISEMFHFAFARKMSSYKDMAVVEPNSLSIVPIPEQNAISPTVPTKHKQIRSAEMVRATDLSLAEERYFRELVRKTRLLYESLRIFLIREEDRGGTGEALGLPPGARKRADMKAAAAMLQRGLWLNRDKRIVGTIPGVYVGDQFFFRMEMCVIGLHGQVQAGIDYVGAARSPNREPIATSIIVSGGYEDDEDAGEVLIYTGHGGKERHVMRHCLNQKLEGGNLALERSRYHGVEVRVIRGIKSERSPTGKVYIYDGLYQIVDHWFDVGKSGFGVYKYRLLRLSGQPEMGTVVFKFAAELKLRPMVARPKGYMSLDISQGKEKMPVYLFNDVDSDSGPLFYQYAVSPVYTPLGFTGGYLGCTCTSSCSIGCYCIDRNGGELVYDSSGILLRGKPVIYECGSSCRCPPSCSNRATQRGLKSRLEIFRSKETGWGVRSLDLIRAGDFICEYTGIVLTRQLAAVISMNGDSLIHPGSFPHRWMEWGDISHVFPGCVQPGFPSLPPLDFALDVSRLRNVACYFSHSCTPNVMVQVVLYDHCNVMYPHLMVFAMENIPPLRELSVDFGVTTEWSGETLAIDCK
ncbi:histone-lysine N-methyltransferase family member SUVH9-like [Aristolochia californica]|uniref:histone-lysine N-methyltransferase family member SUVH9-like n=1 Tax=Aristolochia californica TaxID=171875 RepID=UPI0035DE4B8D